MCDICKEAIRLWPEDDDAFGGGVFDQLRALAQLIEGTPGSHLVGVGLTGRPDVQ
jgi:hypothetical protein